jgi:uncharacterized protein YraI
MSAIWRNIAMRSKFAPFFAAAALAASVGSAAAYEAYPAYPEILRAGPGIGFAAITTVPAYSPVNVTSCGRHWCQVAYADVAGYVTRSFLVAGAPAPYAPVAAGPFDILVAPLGLIEGVAAATVAPVIAPVSPPAPVVATY